VLTALIISFMGMMPGMPGLPMFGLAGVLGWHAMRKPKTKKAKKAKTDRGDGAPPTTSPAGSDIRGYENDGADANKPEDIDAALSLDILSLELGYELVGMVDATKGGNLLDRVAGLRREIAKELGIVVPPVHVCDNLELPPAGYRILLSGSDIGQGVCEPGRILAIDPTGTAPPLEGDATTEPTYGMPARWIPARDREMAEALGYTVVDHATVIATHLAELVRNQAHRLVGRQELQHLIDLLAEKYPKLVDDVVPNLLSLGEVLRVLRNLLRERISIRDLRTLMESLAELSDQTKDSEQLTELVRERLSHQITALIKGPDGSVAALALDPHLEEHLRNSLRDIAAGVGGALEPELLRHLAAQAEEALAKFSVLGVPPIIIAPPDLRRYVRAIFEHKVAQFSVVSYREIEADIPLRVVDSLGKDLATTLAPQGGE
jgi:flagellar biosynthesis protein FlhA